MNKDNLLYDESFRGPKQELDTCKEGVISAANRYVKADFNDTPKDFIYNYMLALTSDKPFDFYNYTISNNSHYIVDTDDDISGYCPFREIETVKSKLIRYRSKVYTSFSNLSLGMKYPLLLYVLQNQKTINDITAPTYCDKDYNNTNKFIDDYIEANKQVIDNNIKYAVSDDKLEIINKSFNNFISYFSSQNNYNRDEASQNQLYSMIRFLVILYLDFYNYIEDTENVNKIFTFLHEVGNKKAKIFSQNINDNTEDNKEFKERPLYLDNKRSISFMMPLSFNNLYSYIKFYESYKDGIFIKKICNSTTLRMYRDEFKKFLAISDHVDDKYYALYNKYKDANAYPLEMYEYITRLAWSDNPITILDALEQNTELLDACLVDEDLHISYSYERTMNILKYIKLEKLSDDDIERYWRMIANHINNSTYKNKKIKAILRDLATYLGYDLSTLICQLQSYLNSNKQTLLVELYLE